MRSPDGEIAIQFYLDNGKPKYEINVKGEPLLESSAPGLAFEHQLPLASGLTVIGTERGESEQAWNPVYGTSREVRDRFNQLTIRLQEREFPGRKLTVIFRAYDDGVAFRYHLPEQNNMDQHAVTGELTTFDFVADYRTYAMSRAGFNDNYGEFYRKIPLSAIREDSLISMPLLLELQNGWASVSEAALTPHNDDHIHVKARVNTPFFSPWRTVMIGERAGDLIESNLILNLNKASEITDTSFIKPGHILFPWWNGGIAENLERSGKPSTEVMKYYIDFTAEFDIPHLMVDAGWYSLESEVWEEPEEQNLLTMEDTREAYYDIHEVITYGRQKNVHIHLWVHLASLRNDVEEVLSTYAEWGVAGIKVDSFGGDNQKQVTDLKHVVRVAEENGLM